MAEQQSGSPSSRPGLLVRDLGQQPYVPMWQAMREFTDRRGPETRDEIWLLEHPPIFTLGQAGRREHVLDPGAIPIIESDRGGQVTYHGPGQLIAYLLLDIRRAGLGVKRLVNLMEQAIIDLLASEQITGETRRDAPGVYVGGAKIASLGLRVRSGCTYHGLALNLDLDLEPFARINPCGHPGQAVTRLVDLGVPPAALLGISDKLARGIALLLGVPAVSAPDVSTPPAGPALGAAGSSHPTRVLLYSDPARP